MIDHEVKKDFPLLQNQSSLVYLDSAATSQKPRAVIDAITDYYESRNANVHRGVYKLAEISTVAYENAREKVKQFINAKFPKEIVFTRNATEAINLVAHSWLGQETRNRRQETNILISQMEHHSNIVPWQLASRESTKTQKARKREIHLEAINLTEDFRLDLDDFESKLRESKPSLVAITHASNVLGTVNPVKEIVRLARQAGAKVLVDGAQAVPHMLVDMQDLDADFYVFSGHKMLGPTGVGVLYAKQNLLENMNPLMGGGEMISRVSFESSKYNELPWKFEAGTPNMAGAVGLGAAIDYLQDIGFAAIHEHETVLTQYALNRLTEINGLQLYGSVDSDNRLGVFSFTIDGIHAHDVASLLDEENIAVRAGHHCAMPLHQEVLKQPATARASLYIYNTKEDIDKLLEGLERVVTKFK